VTHARSAPIGASALPPSFQGDSGDANHDSSQCAVPGLHSWCSTAGLRPRGKELPDDLRVQAIATAAKDLVEKRDRWLNPEGATEAEPKERTLTKLYNERPTWLDLAHKKLDDAVLDAYAWPHDLADEAILERLLALNLKRASAQGVEDQRLAVRHPQRKEG